jgi:lambda family phage portal protein
MASDNPATWLDRALGAVGLQRALPRRATHSTRVYGAARMDRLTNDLFAQTLSANDELKTDLRRLRGLARRLVRDTAYGARFVNLVTEQVLGADGILLQSRVEKRRGGLNVGLNRTLETAWERWGQPGTCTADGMLAWAEVEDAFLRSLAIDGEGLLRLVRGAPNAFGFAVELIDPDYLDDQYTTLAPSGNKIVMGVEVDSFNRPVAYWLYDKHPSEFPTKRVRVPADEIVHAFLVKRIGARRGEPWSSCVLTDASTLAAFLEASVHAARIGASRMAAIERDKDVEMDDDFERTVTPDEVAPGQILDLAPGERLNSLNWQYPTGEIDPFTKIILRALAAGLNVSYSSLSGDLSDVNYSSIRAGLLVERDGWRKLQRFLIDRLHWPVYRAWREMAVLSGQLPARPIGDYDRVTWQARGWAWVNPVDEVNANAIALQNRLTTRRKILAEQGLDLEDVLEGLAEEEKMMQSLGLTTDPVAPPAEPARAATPPVRRLA